MLITLVIFSLVILGLTGLSFSVARRGTRATHDLQSLSAMVARTERATTIEFDSLPTLAGCDSTTRGNVAIVSCLTVATVSQRLSEITIVVTTSVPGTRPDTVRFRRGLARDPLPLR